MKDDLGLLVYEGRLVIWVLKGLIAEHTSHFNGKVSDGYIGLAVSDSDFCPLDRAGDACPSAIVQEAVSVPGKGVLGTGCSAETEHDIARVVVMNDEMVLALVKGEDHVETAVERKATE